MSEERQGQSGSASERYPSRSNEFLLFLNLLLMLTCVALLFKANRLVHAKEKHTAMSEDAEEMFFRFAKTFNEVYNIIQEKYVDVEELDAKDLYEGALEGMFSKLDPHSQYMGASHFKQLDKTTKGKFSGIGVHITIRRGLLTVISPIPGSPGARAGLQSNDRIIEIEGESTEGISIMDAVDQLTGPPGTSVKIKVYREGALETLPFEITRAVIKVKSIYHKVIEDEQNGNIGYVRITTFSEDTSRELKKALIDFKKQNCQGAVLDLRFNTGGLLNQAIEVSDLFMEKGKMIVSTRGREKALDSEFRAKSKPVFAKPLVVLINQGSASASEIVAGAMQDHKRGLVIGPKGEKSFGKGSVQTIERLEYPFELNDEGNAAQAAVRVTTARYYTPSGRSIHNIGITPDVDVELPKFHARDLLQYGLLLGDVALDEPEIIKVKKDDEEESKKDDSEKDDTEEDDSTKDDATTVTEDKKDEVTDSKEDNKEEKDEGFYLNLSKKSPEELAIMEEMKKKRLTLIDIQLEEALKYLKVMIFTQFEKAA